MTIHHLPEQPTGDTVWTWDKRTDEPARWSRVLGDRWIRPGTGPDGEHFTWPALLAEHGPVSDQHPALPDGAPLPWSWDEEEGVLDADGFAVNLGDLMVSGFVVSAANAYAERANGGEQVAPPSPTRYTAAVDEAAALWSGARADVRAAVDVECGGLVGALDRLLAAVRGEQ